MNLTCTDAYRRAPPLYGADRTAVISALIPLLQDTEHWENRWNIEWYVNRCIDAGFCKTDDQIRLCAQRYIAGKRKITPPGTKRRKVAAKKKQDALANVDPHLMAIVDAVIAVNDKAVQQFKGGTEKALNALVGGVMKQFKTDPAIVKDLLIRRIG